MRSGDTMRKHQVPVATQTSPIPSCPFGLLCASYHQTLTNVYRINSSCLFGGLMAGRRTHTPLPTDYQVSPFRLNQLGRSSFGSQTQRQVFSIQYHLLRDKHMEHATVSCGSVTEVPWCNRIQSHLRIDMYLKKFVAVISDREALRTLHLSPSWWSFLCCRL